MRPWGSIEQLRRELRTHFPGLADLAAAPHRLRMLRLDLTSRCNLRCTYCAVSQPEYDGREMPAALVAATLSAVVDHGDIFEVALNGHGETTFRKGWEALCERFLASGLRLSITTNLARPLGEREIDVLSRFQSVVISIDGADAALMKAVRRRTDIGTVLLNYARIRARSMAAGVPLPRFIFQCGIYDRSVSRLVDFAWFAVACGVDAVSFWHLKKYPDINGVTNVYPLASLAEGAFLAARAAYREARDILIGHGVQVVESGDPFARGPTPNFRCAVDVVRIDGPSGKGGRYRLHVVPEEPSAERVASLFFAGRKSGRFYLFREGTFRRLDDGEEPAAVVSAGWVEQTVVLPIDESATAGEMDAYYFGCGGSFAEMLEASGYFQVEVRIAGASGGA